MRDKTLIIIKERDEARAKLAEAESLLRAHKEALAVCERICHHWPKWHMHPHRQTVLALLGEKSVPENDSE